MGRREKLTLEVLKELGLLPPMSPDQEVGASDPEDTHVEQFMRDRCSVSHKPAKTLLKDVYAAYCEWCDDNGMCAVSRVGLSEKLRSHGVTVKNGTANKVTCYGLSLIESKPSNAILPEYDVLPSPRHDMNFTDHMCFTYQYR